MKLSPQKAAEANTRLIFIALSVISAISLEEEDIKIFVKQALKEVQKNQ